MPSDCRSLRSIMGKASAQEAATGGVDAVMANRRVDRNPETSSSRNHGQIENRAEHSERIRLCRSVAHVAAATAFAGRRTPRQDMDGSLRRRDWLARSRRPQLGRYKGCLLPAHMLGNGGQQVRRRTGHRHPHRPIPTHARRHNYRLAQTVKRALHGSPRRGYAARARARGAIPRPGLPRRHRSVSLW